MDVQELRSWLHENYTMLPSTTAAEEAVALVASRNARDPHREWLEGLRWDGECRLDRMLADCFGVPESDLTRAQGRKWAISAVARALRPGCQVDTILILKGPQGARKTSGFRALAGDDYFAAPAIDPGSKDSVLATHGVWIIEWAELDSLKRSETTAVKAFISERADRIRVPYQRRPQTFPRRCVFIGTTNDDAFLTDTTGDRRFWVVASERVDLDRIVATREQLWAEAVARYRSGEQWWLTDAEDTLRSKANEAYRYEDPWISVIEGWMSENPDPFELDDLMYDAGQRATRFDSARRPGLALSPGRANQYDRQRAKRLLLGMGLTERRVKDGGRWVRRWAK